MKISVLMLSRLFPVGHRRAGKPTCFADLLTSGRKVHTIRSNYEHWASIAREVNAGERIISLRQWSGEPYRSRQVEIGRLTELTIQEVAMFNLMTGMEAFVNGKEVPVKHLAANDGLDMADFESWFRPQFEKSNEFKGVILFFDRNKTYK